MNIPHIIAWRLLCLQQKMNFFLFCLPPHTTHVAQPLDVSIFASLKSIGLEHAMNTQLMILVEQSQSFRALRFLTRLGFWPYNQVSGFWKVGIYPFNPTAFKPYEISNSESASVTKPSDFITNSTPQREFESCQIESSMPSTISFSEDQINLFERRYDNGYVYDDQMYVAWLKQ